MVKVQGCSLVALGLLLNVSIVVGQTPFKWSSITSKQINVCRERQCHERAKLLLESMDKTVNPCDDFYEYACGQWIKQNRIPPHQYEWSVEAKLDFQAIQELSDLLKKSVTPRDTEEIIKAKQLYLVCKNIPTLPKMQINLLKSYVKRAGPWPMFNPDQKDKVSWLDIHNFYLKTAGDAGLFGIGTRYDGDLDEVYLKVGNPPTPSGIIQHFGVWGGDELYKHQQFLLTLAEQVMEKSSGTKSPENNKSKKNIVTPKSLLSDILDVIMFRERLEKNIHPDPYDPTPMPLKYFQLWYDIKVTSQKGGVKIPWMKILDNLFKETSLNPIDGDSKIVIMHRDSFSFLPRLLATTPKHVIANHLHLYFIEKHVLLTSDLMNAVSRTLIHNGKVIGTMNTRLERSDHCVTTHPMKDTLARMYLDRYFEEGTKQSALYYALKMKNMMRIFISSSNWMDKNLKEVVQWRLTNVALNMAYSSNRKGEYVYAKDKKMAPYRALSFYTPKDHNIFISAGYFRPPVFDHELPSAVNYGTISTFIAYELYHSITTEHFHAEHITPYKGLCDSCLPGDLQKTFDKKAKCFEDMYTDQVDKDLEKIRPLPKSNAVRTLYENIADVMAIKTGMEAFKKLLWESDGKCRILPHMKDYTCEKLFFVSYAATFCSNIPTWALLKHTQMGTHSTPRLRVNVPLANMEEFRTAFKCPKNSPMVAQHRCTVF